MVTRTSRSLHWAEIGISTAAYQRAVDSRLFPARFRRRLGPVERPLHGIDRAVAL